ncbi:MAG TPA: phage protease [Terriglobia bacterium]|nr:phage protease [Terriglobia bacterium]
MDNAEVQVRRNHEPRATDHGPWATGNGQQTTDHGLLITDANRHFAWELFSAGSPVKKDGKDLHEVPVAVCGAWVKNGHTFKITFQDLQTMLRNFDKRRNEMVVIDYEHASEDPSVARGGPVPAAGWIHELFLERAPSSPGTKRKRHPEIPAADTLLARVEWTPEAKELIHSGQYRFFSPSIDWGARDKVTGKAQGATLTSGALTNHPFLEELPPLMLTDLEAVEAEAGANPREIAEPAPARDGTNASGKGETEMEAKRLSIRMLTEGTHAGHHGIFYGDELVGYMTDADFCHYAEKHLAGGAVAPPPPAAQRSTEGGTGAEPLPAVQEGARSSGDGAALSALFAERVGATGAALEEIRDLVESARRAQAREQEASARALILSEVVPDGRLRVERALELARAQKISLADYVAVEAAERALDHAVVEGKILPRDRHFFFRDALERPREFKDYVEGAAAVVRLGSAGIGSGEPVPVDQEVDLGARRLMSEQKISYGKALKALFRENPALEARYRAAHRPELKPDGESVMQ